MSESWKIEIEVLATSKMFSLFLKNLTLNSFLNLNLCEKRKFEVTIVLAFHHLMQQGDFNVHLASNQEATLIKIKNYLHHSSLTFIRDIWSLKLCFVFQIPCHALRYSTDDSTEVSGSAYCMKPKINYTLLACWLFGFLLPLKLCCLLRYGVLCHVL